MTPFRSLQDEVRGAKSLKEMVGTRRLELLTCAASKAQQPVIDRPSLLREVHNGGVATGSGKGV